MNTFAGKQLHKSYGNGTANRSHVVDVVLGIDANDVHFTGAMDGSGGLSEYYMEDIFPMLITGT